MILVLMFFARTWLGLELTSDDSLHGPPLSSWPAPELKLPENWRPVFLEALLWEAQVIWAEASFRQWRSLGWCRSGGVLYPRPCARSAFLGLAIWQSWSGVLGVSRVFGGKAGVEVLLHCGRGRSYRCARF